MSKQIHTHDVGWYHYENAYPWHDWFDGQARLLTPGEDFQQSLPAFRTLAYRVARENGYRLRTRTMEGGLAIQALDSEGHELKPPPA